MNRVIIIQGPSTNVDVLKKKWKGYNIIWSTWDGEEQYYSKEDIVIYNTKPQDFGTQNIGLQHKTTIEGIKMAIDLGFERVLKWRSDLIPTNPNELLDLFDKDKLNFLAWHTGLGGYFVDYFIEGVTNQVYDAWDINTFIGTFSERITTDNIFNKGLSKFNFIGSDLNENNDIFWAKYNIMLSTYKNNPAYTTYIKK